MEKLYWAFKVPVGKMNQKTRKMAERAGKEEQNPFFLLLHGWNFGCWQMFPHGFWAPGTS